MDGGNNWSAAILVNDDATTNAQWFPWATVDPVSGDISVIFYDRRDDAGDLLTTEYVAYSSDGGSTWTNLRVGDVQFTPAPIPGLAAGYMGDYLGIGARGCAVYPAWGDSRTTPFTTYVSLLVIDDAPPTITCPANVTIVCGESTDPTNAGFATATDSCDPDPTLDFADAVFPTTCPEDPVQEVIQRTWTATDASENTSDCIQEITVLKVVLDADIRPGSCPNPFRPGSRGVLPVGLLGTDAFDVTSVELPTVELSRADCVDGTATPLEGPRGPHSVLDDVGTPFDGEFCACHELEGNGILDSSLKFDSEEVASETG